MTDVESGAFVRLSFRPVGAEQAVSPNSPLRMNMRLIDIVASLGWPGLERDWYRLGRSGFLSQLEADDTTGHASGRQFGEASSQTGAVSAGPSFGVIHRGAVWAPGSICDRE